MPVGWVNFLKQRFDVLGIDYKQVGAGRIVVTSTPRAAESVVRLVVSAIETANDYAKTVLRSICVRSGSMRTGIQSGPWIDRPILISWRRSSTGLDADEPFVDVGAAQVQRRHP
jgi:hypothetical protein